MQLFFPSKPMGSQTLECFRKNCLLGWAMCGRTRSLELEPRNQGNMGLGLKGAHLGSPRVISRSLVNFEALALNLPPTPDGVLGALVEHMPWSPAICLQETQTSFLDPAQPQSSASLCHCCIYTLHPTSSGICLSPTEQKLPEARMALT